MMRKPEYDNDHDAYWNYRVIVDETGKQTIREVWYKKNKAVAWSSKPIEYLDHGDTRWSFLRDYMLTAWRMAKALSKPIMYLDNGRLREDV